MTNARQLDGDAASRGTHPGRLLDSRLGFLANRWCEWLDLKFTVCLFARCFPSNAGTLLHLFGAYFFDRQLWTWIKTFSLKRCGLIRGHYT